MTFSIKPIRESSMADGGFSAIDWKQSVDLKLMVVGKSVAS